MRTVPLLISTFISHRCLPQGILGLADWAAGDVVQFPGNTGSNFLWLPLFAQDLFVNLLLEHSHFVSKPFSKVFGEGVPCYRKTSWLDHWSVHYKAKSTAI